MEQILDFIADYPLALIPIVLVPMYFWEQWRGKGLQQAYEALSHDLGGSVEEDSGGRPKLVFERTGKTFTLSTVRGTSNVQDRSTLDRTELEVYTPESLRFFLSLTRENEDSFVDKMMGTKSDFKVNDRSFDKAYLIQTDRQDLTLEFLTEETRARLLNPEGLGSQLLLRVNEGSFKAATFGYVTDVEKLKQFVEQGLHHFDSMQTVWAKSG